MRSQVFRQIVQKFRRQGAGIQWIPLPTAEAPTEPTGETMSPVKKFLCKMTENMQADDVQRR